jgi:hypothetical protein
VQISLSSFLSLSLSLSLSLPLSLSLALRGSKHVAFLFSFMGFFFVWRELGSDPQRWDAHEASVSSASSALSGDKSSVLQFLNCCPSSECAEPELPADRFCDERACGWRPNEQLTFPAVVELEGHAART